jgi:hypothetical protein
VCSLIRTLYVDRHPFKSLQLPKLTRSSALPSPPTPTKKSQEATEKVLASAESFSKVCCFLFSVLLGVAGTNLSESLCAGAGGGA